MQEIQTFIMLYCLVFVSQVLKDEFPKGVDIIYESVGGEMFDLCLNALATYGRLIVIGMISQVRMKLPSGICYYLLEQFPVGLNSLQS